MTEELQQREKHSDESEIEDLVDMEDKMRDRMIEEEISTESVDVESTDFQNRLRSKVNDHTVTVQGQIESIEKTDDDRISVTVSHDDTTFTEEFNLNQEENVNDSRLATLLNYLDIPKGRFMDLRGSDVPIDTRGAQSNIVVPENKNRVSNLIFRTFQKSRKYKLVRSRFGRSYEPTYHGYFAGNVISAALLLSLGYILGGASTLISSIPVISIFSGLLLFMSTPLLFFGYLAVMTSVIMGFALGLRLIFQILFIILTKARSKYDPFE